MDMGLTHVTTFLEKDSQRSNSLGVSAAARFFNSEPLFKNGELVTIKQDVIRLDAPFLPPDIEQTRLSSSSTLTNAFHTVSPSSSPPMPPKPQLTHFLCLPLITPSSKPQFQASLQRFTSEVTSPNASAELAIPPKAIRPVGALHLTIGVMSLLTPERLEAACSFLRELDITAMLKAAHGHLLTPLTFSGLHPMGTPEKTSSLYATPSSPSAAPLIPFCTALRQAFTAAEFLVPETRPMKLHATVVNTIYAREAKSGKKRWGKGSGKFDARELVERYREFEWAREVRMERVSICEMGAKKVLEGEVVVDQVYTEVASVPLPVIEGA